MRLLWFNLATDADDPILGFTENWIQAVSEQVEHIDVLTMRSGRFNVPDNVRVRSIGKERGYSRVRRVGKFYLELFNMLRSSRIDACFSHMMPLFTVLSGPVLKLKGIPIATWYTHPAVGVTLRLAHHLSDRMVTSFPTSYRYRHDKLSVMGHGINTDRFTPGSHPPAGTPHVLCAGRLSPVKDHPTLLKAVALLHERRGLPLRLTILGSPARTSDETYVASLRDLSRDLRIDSTVRFVPGVSTDQLADWYCKCNVHINMTQAGFGDKVALEAMACARPCIVANTDFEETLGRFTPDLLYNYGDPESLSVKLESLLDRSLEERHRMGVYLREQIIRLHSLRSLAKRIVQLLETLRNSQRLPA